MTDCCVGLSCEKTNSQESLYCEHGRFKLTCEICMILKISKRMEKLELSVRSLEGFENAVVNNDSKINDRIKELEKFHQDFKDVLKNDIKEHHGILNKIYDRIEKLEQHYYSAGDLFAIHSQIENINKNDKYDEHQRLILEKRINELEKKFKTLNSEHVFLKSNYAIPEVCNSCNGKGIVWG